MLVSHEHKFIFLKSIKTASTSVFGFFLPYCLPKEKAEKYNYSFKSSQDLIGKYQTGMIGLIKHTKGKEARLQHVQTSTAKKTLDSIDENIWKDYFKFSIVRNPFDLLVSLYFFRINYTWKVNPKLKPKGNLKLPFKKPNNLKEHKQNFYQFLTNLINDKIYHRPKGYIYYKINNEFVCDYHIRYENLKEGIEYVCQKCNIKNYNFKNLKHFRSNTKPKNLKYQDMYNETTKELAYNFYKEDFEKFDYKF